MVNSTSLFKPYWWPERCSGSWSKLGHQVTPVSNLASEVVRKNDPIYLCFTWHQPKDPVLNLSSLCWVKVLSFWAVTIQYLRYLESQFPPALRCGWCLVCTALLLCSRRSWSWERPCWVASWNEWKMLFHYPAIAVFCHTHTHTRMHAHTCTWKASFGYRWLDYSLIWLDYLLVYLTSSN